MKQLLLDYTPYCTRAALVEDGELIEFSIEKNAAKGIVGNIYKGKVENVLSGMEAAFVNIGLERNGFLYVGESLVDSKSIGATMPRKKLNVSPGDIIMCQVVKDQFGQKGARLTTDITLPGHYLVLLPTSSFIGVSRKVVSQRRREYLEQLVTSICPEGMGFILRSAADKAQDEDIISEAESLIELWGQVQADYKRAKDKSVVFEEGNLFDRALRDTFGEDVEKVVVNDEEVAKSLEGKVGDAAIEVYNGERNIMAHFNVSEQINRICDRRVYLENGAYIVIDKTEALTVIDVNTGKFAGSKDLEDTVYKTNLAAAVCIAKQLRLRNISGIVVIDFIDMQNEEHKEQVIETLKEALKNDRLKTSTVGMTPLGLVELTRKKTRLQNDEYLLQNCTHCHGGYTISNLQLVFMLRDELLDYMLSNKCDVVYVGVSQVIYDTIAECEVNAKQIGKGIENKKIYIYVGEHFSRQKHVISENAPDPLPANMFELVNQED
ncbi:MAG: Rne/Rng family ribonuclease [Clostridia bacterium]|nr:Rne/Rng family ribonuclease [Clostridia bacterium]